MFGSKLTGGCRGADHADAGAAAAGKCRAVPQAFSNEMEWDKALQAPAVARGRSAPAPCLCGAGAGASRRASVVANTSPARPVCCGVVGGRLGAEPVEHKLPEPLPSPACGRRACPREGRGCPEGRMRGACVVARELRGLRRFYRPAGQQVEPSHARLGLYRRGPCRAWLGTTCLGFICRAPAPATGLMRVSNQFMPQCRCGPAARPAAPTAAAMFCPCSILSPTFTSIRDRCRKLELDAEAVVQHQRTASQVQIRARKCHHAGRRRSYRGAGGRGDVHAGMAAARLPVVNPRIAEAATGCAPVPAR